MQDISSFQYSVRLEVLGGFFRDQHWMHMHDVLRSRGITFHELGHRGLETSLAILEAEGFRRKEALREIGLRRRRGALASLEAQGFTGDGGTRSASTELGHHGRGGALASIEAQGFTGEGWTRSASTELARRGGEALSAIIRKSGTCKYPGCGYAIVHGQLCIKHYQPIKAEKSDKCRVCERVLGVNEKSRGGVCSRCYQKPEATAARKKAMAEKKATRGTCSTPGCKGINFRGQGKCENCSKPNKYK